MNSLCPLLLAFGPTASSCQKSAIKSHTQKKQQRTSHQRRDITTSHHHQAFELRTARTIDTHHDVMLLLMTIGHHSDWHHQHDIMMWFDFGIRGKTAAADDLISLLFFLVKLKFIIHPTSVNLLLLRFFSGSPNVTLSWYHDHLILIRVFILSATLLLENHFIWHPDHLVWLLQSLLFSMMMIVPVLNSDQGNRNKDSRYLASLQQNI